MALCSAAGGGRLSGKEEEDGDWFKKRCSVFVGGVLGAGHLCLLNRTRWEGWVQAGYGAIP